MIEELNNKTRLIQRRAYVYRDEYYRKWSIRMEAFMTNKVDWAAHLQAIETEGISIKDYAAREGLSVASLYYHRRRVSDEGRRTEGASALVAVQLAERHAIQPCTVWLAPGVRMELATLPSPQWLGQLVASMSAQVH